MVKKPSEKAFVVFGTASFKQNTEGVKILMFCLAVIN